MPRPQSEHQIEYKCVAMAEEAGFLHIKLDTAKRSWPDRLFLGHGGIVWFVEFKRPGEKPRVQQEAYFDKLAERGHPVTVIDSVDQFRQDMELLLLLKKRIS